MKPYPGAKATGMAPNMKRNMRQMRKTKPATVRVKRGSRRK